jgi:hypothetical protein
MKKLILLAGCLFFGSANAAIVGTFDFGSWIQSGTVTNTSGDTMVGFQIDFVADSGSPLSPIWETGASGLPGTPAATFSNVPMAGGAFTAGWYGLSIADGGTFSYSNMDLGLWTGSGINQGTPPVLLGDEYATIFFASGAQVSSYFSAGDAYPAGQLVFDDANASVPEPSSLTLMLLGLAGTFFARKKKAA